MNINIDQLAQQFKIDKKVLEENGIKNGTMDDTMIIEILSKFVEKKQNFYTKDLLDKEAKLKGFKEKLKREQTELVARKEKLQKEEIAHRTKLEKLKIETITKLKEEFLESIKGEYEKVNSKLDELTRKELKLIEWQQGIDHNKAIFTQEKEIFDSTKEKMLSEYKQWIETQKEIFENQQEEEKVKKLDEVNKKIQELYREKEKEISIREETLIKFEAELKTKAAEISAKEKNLESQSESIYNQEKDKVREELKNLQAKVDSFEMANEKLREELSDKQQELDSYEKFEDRDLPRELDDKQQEVILLKKQLEEETRIKNDLREQISNQEKKYEGEKIVYENEKDELLKENLEVKALKSRIALLEDKNISASNNIEFLQGENKDLNDRLKSIYSDGTEIEERIKDIKEKPYKEISLDTQLNVTNEIEYLDSIQKSMEDYGVVYPKRLLYAFHTALKSAGFSPLAVLSGVSGTGKSELPKLYSHFGGFNFLAEAVQPTWDSPASMIGYYNTIDRKFDSTNILKFLLQTSQSKDKTQYGLKESMNMILLDEMNLAHIELYFAEFLSKFEQRRGSKGVNIDIQLGTALNYPLPLDNNVLWIGTMNEDETTKALSDKVLDRAFSINFPRPTELKSRAKLKTLDEIKKFEYLDRKTWNKWIQKESLFTDENKNVLQQYKKMANKINEYLAPTGRAIGHRVWQSMEYYINNHPLVINSIDNEDELIKNVKFAFEEQLVQKIMPKLRGIEVHGKEKESLENIKGLLTEFKIAEDFELSMDNPYGQFIWNSANYLKED